MTDVKQVIEWMVDEAKSYGCEVEERSRDDELAAAVTLVWRDGPRAPRYGVVRVSHEAMLADPEHIEELARYEARGVATQGRAVVRLDPEIPIVAVYAECPCCPGHQIVSCARDSFTCTSEHTHAMPHRYAFRIDACTSEHTHAMPHRYAFRIDADGNYRIENHP